MFKRISLGAALTVVLVVLFGAIAQAGSSSSTSAAASNDSDEQRLVLTERTEQQAIVDLAKNNRPDLGDYLVFTNKLLQQGQQVGTNSGTCTVVRLKSSGGTLRAVTYQCVVTLSLRKGQITVQGLLTVPATDNPSATTKVAITGGTNAYKTAHGEMTVIIRPQQDTKLIVDLILSD
jgi:hypothetical protein